MLSVRDSIPSIVSGLAFAKANMKSLNCPLALDVPRITVDPETVQ